MSRVDEGLREQAAGNDADDAGALFAELLEALRQVATTPHLVDPVSVARAAIAKAEGRS